MIRFTVSLNIDLETNIELPNVLRTQGVFWHSGRGRKLSVMRRIGQVCSSFGLIQE